MEEEKHAMVGSIPDLFRKSDSKTPFDECHICACSLDQKQYLVEKAIRNYPSLGTSEVIFEYAVCITCTVKMRMELSEDSRNRIESYFLSNVNREAHQKRISKSTSLNLDLWVANCIVKDTAVKDSQEYSIYALCDGDKIVLGELPYALSGESMDEMTQLLSAKSLDILDNFIGTHFSGPPEVRDILKRKPLLV